MRRYQPTLLLLLMTPAVLSAQGPETESPHGPVPIAQAVRTDAVIRIDGVLDEATWSTAPVVDEFTQIDPNEGAPASQLTEARILYDDQALYVGIRLHDTGEITGRLGRRDMDLGDSDWVGVMIDSYHDHRTAYGFDVNPAGVRRDEVKVITQDDNSWDPVWEVATSVDEGGWTAEYRIPFSQLRFGSAPEQTWGIQLERVIGRNREYAVSSFTPKSEQGGVPRYGHLEGLRNIKPGKRLEILPYTVLRGEYVDPGANPFRTDEEYGVSAGVDVLYRITSDFTLNATLNPDFGQVEVDPAVVNLGVYETFFAEKRPFFVEGSEIFNFGSGGGGSLFYSRRIGRSPQLGAPTAAADIPVATTILGAAKLSGKTRGGWSIGVLEAVTAEEEARYMTLDGEEDFTVVEPLTNYFVGRARRELNGGRTTFGGLLTATNRQMDGEIVNARLRSAAYTGGIDFRHEFSDRTWAVRGSLAASRVLGEPSAILAVQRASSHYFQRPDADHLELDPDATSLSGLSGQVSVEKQAGEHWRGELLLATTTPGFEVNDLGFNYRTDRRDIQLSTTYLENQPGSFWRNYSISSSARFEGNYDNQLIANWLRVNGFFRHLDYWAMHVGLSHSLRANDDRLTRGGPLAVRPANSTASFFATSDARKAITVEAQAGTQWDEFGGWGFEVNPQVGLKASPRWNMSIGPSFYRSHAIAQYVTTVEDPAATETFGNAYVFAELDYTEIGLEARLNYTFKPGLSLEVFAQPLLSNGDYGAPKQLSAPQTFDFEPYSGDAPNRDFNIRSLRGNAVLRWEWRKGSTLYLAWQQSRAGYGDFGDFDFARDRRALFAAEPDNIFLLKVNYWLNP